MTPAKTDYQTVDGCQRICKPYKIMGVILITILGLVLTIVGWNTTVVNGAAGATTENRELIKTHLSAEEVRDKNTESALVRIEEGLGDLTKEVKELCRP